MEPDRNILDRREFDVEPDPRRTPRPQFTLALGACAALALATHPRIAQRIDPSPGFRHTPTCEVIGPRCPLAFGPTLESRDGLWILPPPRQIVPFELIQAGYPDTLVRPHDLVVEVVCTAYSSTPDQTDSTPRLTASMKSVQPGFIALSRDLLRRYTADAPFDYGDLLEIIGVGVFRVEDTMHSRWRRRADIWVRSRREARLWGRRHVLLARIEAAEGDAEPPPILADSPLVAIDLGP